MKKILIINASHREGNTDKIIQLFKQNALDHEVRELLLRNIEMKSPDGCKNCAESEICQNTDDEFSRLIEPTIRNYDVYVLATPTWSDNVTPLALVFWNRIVSWCHQDRKYLRGKKLAVITHGMAGQESWQNVISWIKSICTWEECNFGGSFTCKSGSSVDEVEINQDGLKRFVDGLCSQ